MGKEGKKGSKPKKEGGAIKLDMDFEEAVKKALNTPLKKPKAKKP
jgi:hypothetical protein